MVAASPPEPELEVSYQATEMLRALEVSPGQDRKNPTHLDRTVVQALHFPGTSQLVEGAVLYDSVTGAAGVTDVELTTVPTGELWIPLFAELSHTEAGVSHAMHIGFRWDRATATTSVAIVSATNNGGGANDTMPLALGESIGRVYLPPRSRLYGFVRGLTAPGVAVLKMAYLKARPGLSFPP